jgi:hypothetical protein
MTKITQMSLAAVLAVAAILTASVPVRCQDPSVSAVVGTWEAIKALPSRDELTVTLKNGKSEKGKLSDVTDTAVILSQGKRVTDLRRDEIFQIYRAIPKSRRRATVTGAAVGAGLGVMTASFGDGSSGTGSSPGTAIAGILFTTGLCALIGRGIAGGQERVLIYEARR